MTWRNIKSEKPYDGQVVLVWIKTADPKMPLRSATVYRNDSLAIKTKWHFVNLVHFWSKRVKWWMPFPADPKKEGR